MATAKKQYPAESKIKNRPATPRKSSALPPGDRADSLSINRAGDMRGNEVFDRTVYPESHADIVDPIVGGNPAANNPPAKP